MKGKMKDKMKRDGGDFFFFGSMLKDPQTRQRNLAQNVSKKSPSDELFLHFSFESAESGRFSIIYMIRIRFFGPRELNQKVFSGAQYGKFDTASS